MLVQSIKVPCLKIPAINHNKQRKGEILSPAPWCCYEYKLSSKEKPSKWMKHHVLILFWLFMHENGDCKEIQMEITWHHFQTNVCETLWWWKTLAFQLEKVKKWRLTHYKMWVWIHHNTLYNIYVSYHICIYWTHLLSNN